MNGLTENRGPEKEGPKRTIVRKCRTDWLCWTNWRKWTMQDRIMQDQLWQKVRRWKMETLYAVHLDSVIF